jgi:hypothetical protein
VRIWSLHPKYLDAKGLVALWRETLLAQHVLEGKTKGYKNHPQLDRFKASSSPVDAINYYLKFIYNEASARGYNFSLEKFDRKAKRIHLRVTSGQMEYEVKHLLKKLKERDPAMYKKLKAQKEILPHPVFKIREGDVEDWEII